MEQKIKEKSLRRARRSPSQGEKKFLTHIEELRRNEHFKHDFNKIMKTFKNKTNIKKRDSKIFNFLTKYHIHWGVFEWLGYIQNDEVFDWNEMFYNSHNPDMCYLKDFYGKSYNWKTIEGLKQRTKLLDPSKFFHTTKNTQLIQKSFIQLYPVSIFIHQLASKRDILSYIEKNWKEIDDIMLYYRNRGYKPKKRKFSQELLDYIWNNRKLPTKQIIKKLDENFPGHCFIDVEITKLISLENKKRERKIT